MYRFVVRNLSFVKGKHGQQTDNAARENVTLTSVSDDVFGTVGFGDDDAKTTNGGLRSTRM